MLRKIAAFEMRYHLRSPLFLIGFAIFFLMSFGATVSDFIRIGSGGNVHVNSPAAILQVTGILNLFGLFVFIAFVANVVIRDDETGFAGIIRATQMTKFDYLVGRFLGAFVVAVVVMSSVQWGKLIGSWMPAVDAEDLGPTVISHYLYALFVYAVPTILLVSSVFFALATATRSMMWTYVGAVGFIVLYVVSRLMLGEPEYKVISSLSDPFGLAPFSEVTRYWTATERNTLLPPLSGLLLYNRLIWVSVAVALFSFTYWRFSFSTKGHSKKAAGNALPESEEPIAPPSSTVVGVVSTKPSVWAMFSTLTRFDMKFVFKSPAFFVLLALGVFNSFGAFVNVVDARGTDYFPVTREMIEALVGSFSIFPLIIAIYYAGELVWRDHDRRIHDIVDSTAAPNWSFMVPKVIAVALVLASCYFVAVLAAIIYQAYHGYSAFELRSYFWWFFVPGVIEAIQLAILSVFVQALVPHKFIGWAVMLIYVVASMTLSTQGFEHNLYNFGGSPGVPLSDMNGMGRFWIGRSWLHLYWSAFALLMLVAAHLMWRRGVATFGQRLKKIPARMTGSVAWITGGAALVWMGAGAFVFYNTNILNEYQTQPEIEEWTANYEKTLLQYEKTPQPRIVDVKLAVNIEPQAVKVSTTGSYLIKNRTSAPLTDVHVRWMRPLEMTSLEVEGATVSKEFEDYAYRIYTFATPMQPGEKRTIRFSSVLEQRGFSNSRNVTNIVANGTFVNNMDIAPFLGMSRDAVLRDRSKRRKYGLQPELRPAKLEDEAANGNHYLRSDSDWVTAELQVTTDADQTPIAPGYKVSDTVNGNRRTLITRTDAPIMHFFSMQSARYAEKTDQWKNRDGSTVELAVYFHPQHEHNVQRMLDAMKVSLDVFSTQFAPFQFKQARILEFPAYESFAQSFANTVPYSESIGFNQNYKEAKSDEQIDLVTYVTAHEIGHQWWAHQVIGADKQGMTMLSESFAQYSALLVMEKLYGKEQIRKFLKYELDSYLRSRGGELIEELPLARVEDQPYIHYRKGALTMYWLKEVVGVDVVNRSLSKFLAEYAFKSAPYPSSTDFLRILRAEAGPQHDQLITDLFEKITLYDMKASNAVAKKVGDKYQITFDVAGRKLYADGEGKETEAPLSEPFDIGAFTAEPGKKGYKRESVLSMQRRILTSGKQTIELTLDQLPEFVGVDPYNKRIDRNSDDNLTSVTVH